MQILLQLTLIILAQAHQLFTEIHMFCITAVQMLLYKTPLENHHHSKFQWK